QFQFRTGGEIHILKNLSVVPLGYVYTWNPIYGKQPNKFVNNEHRLWQQVLFKHDIGKVHLSHRGRLEQRYIQVHSISNGEVIYEGFDYYANRFRYRMMAIVPITGKVSASFYDEVFLSWGPPVTYHKPDQNRLFAGVGYQVNKNLVITSGFLYHMLVKANGAMQENNLGVQISAAYNIDLTN
ncbi:MAG TPA: DUF2490 domain-containing protein, partial [Cyclobacteriaceae bacterium]|nr:DUF2490 domain-containing protein [Cyclobacteriaceae bacterium]